MVDMKFVIILFLLLAIISFIIYASNIEQFATPEETALQATPKVTPNYLTTETVEPIITNKITGIVTPMINGLNNLIDSANMIPKKLYCNSMSLANVISSRTCTIEELIHELAELSNQEINLEVICSKVDEYRYNFRASNLLNYFPFQETPLREALRKSYFRKDLN